jgi:hypothetical protein
MLSLEYFWQMLGGFSNADHWYHVVPNEEEPLMTFTHIARFCDSISQYLDVRKLKILSGLVAASSSSQSTWCLVFLQSGHPIQAAWRWTQHNDRHLQIIHEVPFNLFYIFIQVIEFYPTQVSQFLFTARNLLDFVNSEIATWRVKKL